jgi:ribosomal-protein-alanine N-acetyltransferase
MMTHAPAARRVEPGARPAAFEDEATLRCATRRDRAAVRRIECACFGRARFLFGLWRRVGEPGVTAWIAQTQGAPVGYLIAYDKDLDGAPVFYVGGVGVLPRFRQCGHGARLVSAALAGHRQMWLHVRGENAAALAMYRKLGMRVLRRIPQFYSNGEDAALMVTPDLAPDGEKA